MIRFRILYVSTGAVPEALCLFVLEYSGIWNIERRHLVLIEGGLATMWPILSDILV
jgi:hypothetical protein